MIIRNRKLNICGLEHRDYFDSGKNGEIVQKPTILSEYREKEIQADASTDADDISYKSTVSHEI